MSEQMDMLAAQDADFLDFEPAVGGVTQLTADALSGTTNAVIDNGISGYYGTEQAQDDINSGYTADELSLIEEINSMGKSDLAKLLAAQSGGSKVSTPAEIPGAAPKPPGASENQLKDLLSKLGGDKAVAALISGGFGMLGGAGTAKAQEKLQKDRYAQEKSNRDAEWARKDTNSKAGTIQRMKWGGVAPATGLLGTALQK
jgi:hypothetical protein